MIHKREINKDRHRNLFTHDFPYLTKNISCVCVGVVIHSTSTKLKPKRPIKKFKTNNINGSMSSLTDLIEVYFNFSICIS